MSETIVIISDCSHFSLHERVGWYYSNLNCCPLSAPDGYVRADESGCVLTPETKVRFIYTHQRVLIALDLSQSVFTLCDRVGGVLASRLVEVVTSLLEGLRAAPSCDLYSMLKVCFYSLSLMPETCVPVLVLVTDGVSANMDLGGYDDLLMQMHRADISLNVIDVGNSHTARNIKPAAFGCTRNPSLLQFIADTTHGVYTTPQELSKRDVEGTISKSLSRTLQLNCRGTEVADSRVIVSGADYEVKCSQAAYLRCRVTEGFECIEFADTRILMEKRWTTDVSILLQAELMGARLQKVRVSVKCPKMFQGDLLEALIGASAERKRLTKVASKLHWFLEGMKETENFAGTLEEMLQRHAISELCSVFTSLSIAKLHRWLTLAQMYIVTSRTKSQKKMSEGKMALEAALDGWSSATNNKESCYVKSISENEQAFAVVKVQWEGKNVAVVHLCFFNAASALQHSLKVEIRQALKQHRQIVLFPRPLTKLLVESIFGEKRVKSRQLSLFNYRPVPDVIKKYLLHFDRVLKFSSECQAIVTLELICRSRVREEFCYIGECEGTKWQFVKNIHLQSLTQKSICPKSMLQYLAYYNLCELHIEIYFEPNEGFFEGCNEQEAFKMLIEYINTIDDHIANTVKAFQTVLLKCIEMKIGTIEHEIDRGARTLTEADDLFCYFPLASGSPDTYKDMKVDFYSRLYEIYQKYEPEDPDYKVDPPSQDLLDNFDPETREVTLCGSLEDNADALVLVSEMERQFRGIADHWLCAKSREIYYRFISEDELFAWKLPLPSEILAQQKLVIEYYHCKLLNLFPECTMQPSFPFFGVQTMIYVESNESFKPIVENTLKLLDKVIDLSIAHTLADALKNHEETVNRQDVINLLQKCRCITQTVDMSDLREILVPPDWETPSQLASFLVAQSITLESDLFQTIDQDYQILIGKYFKPIPGLKTEYVTVPGEILFLTLSDEISSLSTCLLQPEFNVKFHFLPCVGFFDDAMLNQFRLKSTQTDELSKVSQKIIADVVSSLQSRVAERILELYRGGMPISELKLQRVIRNMGRLCDDSISDLDFQIEFQMQDKIPSADIEWELAHGHIINLRSFGNTLFLVSSQHFTTFYSKEDAQLEYWPLESDEMNVYEEPYTVPFWMIIRVTEGNAIKASYHLPFHLRHRFLTPESVERELTGLVKLLEKRVAQRHLLKQLVETHNCSPLLFKEEEERKDDIGKSPNADRGTSWVKMRRLERKATNVSKSESPYKAEIYRPELKYQHIFQVSDRLAPDEATSNLLRKFSISPFEINNRKRLFMFQKNDFVFVFRFAESTNPNKSRGSVVVGLKSEMISKSLCVRLVKLEMFGIDSLQQGFIDILKKNIDDLLFRLSLEKLADALVKNQKFSMTYNDVEFIKGNSPMLPMLYFLPAVISDGFALLRYVKQNLSRFLTSFKIKDSPLAEFEEFEGKLRYHSASTCLLYNFLNILDSSVQKSQAKYQGKMGASIPGGLFQGGIFGKALALIYVDICYFDGSCSYPVEVFNVPDKRNNFRIINDDLQVGVRYLLADFDHVSPRVLPQTTEPGYYLELRISKKGPLNEDLFTDHIHGCVRQSINEYCLELLFDLYRNLRVPIDGALEQIYNRATQQILKAQNLTECPAVLHCCPQVQLLNLAIRLSEIVTQAAYGGGLPIIYILKVDGEYYATTNQIEDVKKGWSSVCLNERVIGKSVLFRIIMGPDAISRLVTTETRPAATDECKFYSDEDVLGFRTIPRTPYLCVSLTNTHIEALMYNLNKSVAHSVLSNIENEIGWLRKSADQMQFSLMQKLGISFSEGPSLPPPSRSSLQEDLFLQSLPKAFWLLENKGVALVKWTSSDSVALDTTSDEVMAKYKTQGMYPLIKYEKDLNLSTDPVKRHTAQFLKLTQAKRKLMMNRQVLVWILKKWGVPTDRYSLGNERVIEPISLYRNAELRETEKLMKEYAFISLCDKGKVYLTSHLKPLRSRKGGEEKRLKSLINILVDAYAEKFRRNMNGFEYVTKLKEGQSRIRKVSTTDAGSHGSSGQDLKEKGSMTSLDAELKITHQSVLRKIMDETMIVVEFLFENSELTVTAYCLENFGRVMADGRRADTVPNDLLKKELNRVRGQVKTSFFLYEYQIRLTFQYLEKPSNFPAIHILEALDAIMKRYKKTPPGSGAWLYRGIATVDLGAVTGGSEMELFLYMVHNNEQYGLKTLDSTGMIDDMLLYEIASIESVPNRKESLDKAGKLSVQRAFLYQRISDTAQNKRLRPPILLDSIDTPHKIRIRYYIINSDPTRKSRPYESFKDLKDSTEKLIANHMRRVREDYHRDQLYARLHDDSRAAKFGFGDLQSLLRQSEVRRVEEIDPRIKDLTSTKAFDRKFIDYIKEKYTNHYRLLENGDYTHLLLFRSTSQFAYLIVRHKQIQAETMELEMKLVQKNKDCLPGEREDLISNLVKDILLWFWFSLTLH